MMMKCMCEHVPCLYNYIGLTLLHLRKMMMAVPMIWIRIVRPNHIKLYGLSPTKTISWVCHPEHGLVEQVGFPVYFNHPMAIARVSYRCLMLCVNLNGTRVKCTSLAKGKSYKMIWWLIWYGYELMMIYVCKLKVIWCFSFLTLNVVLLLHLDFLSLCFETEKKECLSERLSLCFKKGAQAICTVSDCRLITCLVMYSSSTCKIVIYR
jgi:hypothetical protein